MRIFIISIFLLCISVGIRADTPILEQNDDLDVVVLTALFEKLNWIIREITNVNQKFLEFSKRLEDHEEHTKSYLRALKSDQKELLLQQDVRTDKSLWELKQDLLNSFESQQILLKNTSIEIDKLKIFDVNELIQNRNWQTILRRQDGSIDFDRNWTDYKTGFGNANGEFFIGLEKLHAMTTYAEPQELLIILQDFDNQTRYAKYDSFLIGSEAEKYKIKKIGRFHGDAGDSFSQHLNKNFTTKDQDNNSAVKTNCAQVYNGGWWFSDCYYSFLAGPYAKQPKRSYKKGIIWYSWHDLDYSLKYVEMMIRPAYTDGSFK